MSSPGIDRPLVRRSDFDRYAGQRGEDRDGVAVEAASASAACCSASKAIARASGATTPPRRARRGAAADRGHGGGQARPHRRADRGSAAPRQADRARDSRQRTTTTTGISAERTTRRDIHRHRNDFQRASGKTGPRPARRRMSDGCQRQQARAAADRRCGRPRKVDRPQHRDHARWRTRSPRRRARATAPRPTSTPRSTPRPASCGWRAICWWSTTSRTRRTRSAWTKRASAIPAAQVGDTIADSLPPLEYGRIAAQSAKQVIVQKVREAERDRQYQEYKDRIGDIVNGIVKRVEYGNVVVDLGRGEAIVRRDEMLPRETHAQRRPHPRLHLRRAPRAARPADFPVAHASRSSWRSCSPRKCRKSMTASSR